MRRGHSRERDRPPRLRCWLWCAAPAPRDAALRHPAPPCPTLRHPAPPCPTPSAAVLSGAPRPDAAAMKAGDIILAIDSVVPASPKHAVQLFMQAEYIVNVVVIGHEPDAC